MSAPVDVLAVLRQLRAAAEKSILDAAGIVNGEQVPLEVVEVLLPLIQAEEAARSAIAELISAAEAAEHRLIALDSMLIDETKSRYDCELGEVVRLRAALTAASTGEGP